MRSIRWVAFTVVGSLTLLTAPLLTPCGAQSPSVSPAPSVSGIKVLNLLKEQDELSNVTAFIEKDAELVHALSTPGPFTVLAPLNSAWEQFNSTLLPRLEQPEFILHVRNLLAYHVALGNVSLLDGSTGDVNLTMINGEEVQVIKIHQQSINHTQVELAGEYFAGATLVDNFEQVATNGLLCEIDTVLTPYFLKVDLIALLDNTDPISKFSRLLLISGAHDFLGPNVTTTGFTIFAPTDDAIDAVPVDILNYLTSPTNVQVLLTVVLYHIAPQTYPTVLLQNGQAVDTLEGNDPLTISFSGDTLQVNEATVVDQDLLANNGIVHQIDTLLIPPNVILPTLSPSGAPSLALTGPSVATLVSREPDLTTLTSALRATNLMEALQLGGNLTLFAPLDTAFERINATLAKFLGLPWILHLSTILLYHVTFAGSILSTDLPDGLILTMEIGENVTITIVDQNVTVSGANFQDAAVVEADLQQVNGVVHKVDQVFLPEFVGIDLFDLVSSTADVSTLGALVIQAGLEETVRTKNLTLFAPINDAFEALPPETVSFLTDVGNNETLRNVLLYHVLPVVLPSTLMANESAATVEGSNVSFLVGVDAIFVNEASIILPNGLANNGIGHGINSVLIPPGLALPGLDSETLAPAPATSSPAAPSALPNTVRPTVPPYVSQPSVAPQVSLAPIPSPTNSTSPPVSSPTNSTSPPVPSPTNSTSLPVPSPTNSTSPPVPSSPPVPKPTAPVQPPTPSSGVMAMPGPWSVPLMLSISLSFCVVQLSW